MKFMRRAVLVALTALACQTIASAHEHHFHAVLTGPNEFPANASPGIGTADVTLDLDLVTMRVEVQFSDLLGTVTAAHIHAPTKVALEGTAGVATQVPTFAGFPPGVTSGVFDQVYDLAEASSYNPAFITASGGTVSDALNALIFALEDGKAYLNIHTTAFPAGEIRGFLVEDVPEPATWALLGTGALALLICRRRRRQ